MSLAITGQFERSPQTAGSVAGTDDQLRVVPDLELEPRPAVPAELGAIAIEAPDITLAADWAIYRGDEPKVVQKIVESEPGTEFSAKDVGRLFPEWLQERGRGFVTSNLLAKMKSDRLLNGSWERISEKGKAARYRYGLPAEEVLAQAPAKETTIVEEKDSDQPKGAHNSEGAALSLVAEVDREDPVKEDQVLAPLTAIGAPEPGNLEAPVALSVSISSDEVLTTSSPSDGAELPKVTIKTGRTASVINGRELIGVRSADAETIQLLMGQPTSFESLGRHLNSLGLNSHPTTLHIGLARVRKILDQHFPGFELSEDSSTDAEGNGDIILSIKSAT